MQQTATPRLRVVQRPKLSRAEQRLRAEVAKGRPVRFKGRARRLPADVIRALCVEKAPHEKIEAKRISISGATIVGVLNLEGLALNFPLRLINCVLRERPILTGATLALLDLSGTSCAKGIEASNLKVTTALTLRGFSAEGEVRLYGAEIGGDLDCTGARLANPGAIALTAEGAAIGGSVFLCKPFTAEGEVRFSRTKIAGVLDCSGGHFASRGEPPALSAIGADIAGSVYLRDRFAADGEVSLFAAKIGGDLNCGDGRFSNPGKTALNATGARVEGLFSWQEVAASGSIILEYASASRLEDHVTCWPEREFSLHGFEYKGLGRDALRDAESRNYWLKRQSRFTAQPYEHLISVLRRSGHEDDAREVAIEKKVRLRKSGLLSLRARAWSCFLGFLVAHGYRPSRAFALAAIVVVVGWWVFSNAVDESAMIPTKKEAYTEATPRKLKADYPQLLPPLYSLDVFLPVVNLHQEDYWLPDASQRHGAWYWGYMWAHIVLGWTLTTVLVAALAGLIKKD